MKLQLIARHLRDDQDIIIEEVDNDLDIFILMDRMEKEIEENRKDGSNWRYSIQATEDAYK